MRKYSVGFIGGGNMASSLIGGMIREGCYAPAAITVSDPDKNTREALKERFSVVVMDDNCACAETVDVIVLAVKPQIVKQVAMELALISAPRVPLFVSIVAGIRALHLKRWLALPHGAVVRAMPNTPALIQLSATGMYADAAVNPRQRRQAEEIMNSIGISVWFNDESDLDTVTAVSGSGPAYYFQLMEWMVDAAKQLGLSDAAARRLVLQTALGAARMALESGESPSVLRERVTSPGGATEAALQSLHGNDVMGFISQAISAARARAIALGDEFGAE